jgi:PAS domain S-box
MDSFDFLSANPDLKRILMNSKLTDIIPGGFSIALDVTCERIIHNPVTAKFLRIEPWEQLSFSSPEPLSVKAYKDGKLLSASEMPMQQAASHGKEIVGCEMEFVWEDGISKIARWNAIPLRDENGIICGSIATMDDITEVVHLARELDKHKLNLEKEITERKRIEEVLLESERRYRELVQKAPVGIYEVDFRNKRFLSVNDFMCQMSGYSRKELLEMNPFDILDEQSKITFQTRISQWLNGEKPDHKVDYKVKAKDESDIYAALDVTFTTDENGNPLGATVISHDITERKLIEKALIKATRNAGKNQLILEAVIQQMPVGIILTDASGTVAKNNEAMDKIWRRKMHQSENIKDHGYVAYYPDGRKYEWDEWPLTRSLQKGEVVIAEEMVILRGDGTIGNVSVSSTPVKDQNGQIIAGVAVEVDITECKQTEEALLRYKHKLTEIVENIDGGFITLNTEWQFTDINTRAAENVGYKPADLIGKVIWEVFPKVIGTQMETCFRQCMSERIPIHFEEHGILTNRWYSYDLYPTQEGIVNFWYDITERKKNEERLERSNQKINEILNSIQEVFYVLDRNWNFVYASKSFTSRINKEPKDFVGNNIWNMLPKYIGTVFEENVRHVMDKGEIRRFELEGQYTDSYYRMAVFPSSEGITLLGTDITEQKKIEESLKQSEQHALALVKELKKADRNKNRFLNNLSHELRNPLASIMMSLSLLKRVAPKSEQACQAKEIFERQTIQLSRLVDDLLDVTRISQNKIVLKKELVELNNLVSRTVEDYKNMFDEKEVNLKAEIFSEPIYLQADPTRLTQVIGNLLHNALKFTEISGETQIIISKYENCNEAVIEVRDDGLGIKPVLLPDLFQPFVQAESSLDRNRGGLGLGLAIVKGIVDLHGGSVSANSQGLGKGAQFAIRLPLLPDKDGKQENQLQEDGKIHHSLRIIVIDDIPDVVEILCSLLQLLGHEVTSASNGPEGLAKAMKFAPDVIICDIGLPGMNGYKVARHIRNDHRLKNVFLIALSGYAQADDLATALESGFNRHLAKPVDLDTLEKILAEVQ